MVAYPVIKGVKAISYEAYKVEIYLPKAEVFKAKYAIVKNEVKDRFNYEITMNPVDKIVEVVQENTREILSYLPITFNTGAF